MPAPQRVSNDEVLAAIRRWRGNLQAAADELRIDRKNLRERLRRIGIDQRALDQMRETKRTGTFGVYGVDRDAPERTGAVRIDSPGTHGRKNRSGVFQQEEQARNLPRVQMAAATKDEPEAAPIRSIKPRLSPVRLGPENTDALRSARIDLSALWRVDTDDSTLLNQFFEECFPGWVSSKRAPTTASARPRAVKKGKE